MPYQKHEGEAIDLNKTENFKVQIIQEKTVADMNKDVKLQA